MRPLCETVIEMNPTEWGGGGGVLRFGFDGGVTLKPRNPYPFVRVMLAITNEIFFVREGEGVGRRG